MKKKTEHLKLHSNKYRLVLLKKSVIVSVCFPFFLFSQNINNKDSKPLGGISDEQLIKQYIDSKGSGIIFDASNIKQFWIDRSVLTQNENIHISLNNKGDNGFESIPYKIQLMNVSENQDCKVEVITDSTNADFLIMDSKSKVLSRSSVEQPFVQYHVSSSMFHLEDTPDYSFYLKFLSGTNEMISIKKIILSFSNNVHSSFLSSPGVLKITRDDIDITSAALGDGRDIELKGKQSRILSKKYILVSNKELEISVRVKNVGNNPTNICVGFAAYDQKRSFLTGSRYPYKNINKTLTVISSKDESNKIIVDSYSDWVKNCDLALNAEENLNDIPNMTLATGKIIEVKKLDDGKAEITLDKPLKKALETGANVRIHGGGHMFLFTNNEILQPGEEKIFKSSIKKDVSFLQFSPKALSRGVHSVKPVVVSSSINANEENVVIIYDYTVSY